MVSVQSCRQFQSSNAKATVVYTENLNSLSGDVDNFVLAENAVIENPYAKVKIISRGELTAKLNLSTQFASKTAISAIEKAGGKFTRVSVPKRAKKVSE